MLGSETTSVSVVGVVVVSPVVRWPFGRRGVVGAGMCCHLAGCITSLSQCSIRHSLPAQTCGFLSGDLHDVQLSRMCSGILGSQTSVRLGIDAASLDSLTGLRRTWGWRGVWYC